MRSTRVILRRFLHFLHEFSAVHSLRFAELLHEPVKYLLELLVNRHVLQLVLLVVRECESVLQEKFLERGLHNQRVWGWWRGGYDRCGMCERQCRETGARQGTGAGRLGGRLLLRAYRPTSQRGPRMLLTWNLALDMNTTSLPIKGS